MTPTPGIHSDELLDAFSGLDATLAHVRRHAGTGFMPEVERALEAHRRRLRAALRTDCASLVDDVVDAARCVLESSDPGAPLMALGMAQRSLGSLVHRQAATGLQDAA